ncbi:MAG: alpha/beta hydrolase [Sandaracinaceae bacterium]
MSSSIQAAARAAIKLGAALTGPGPRNDRGARVDAETWAMLRALEISGRPTIDELGPDAARREMTRLTALSDLPSEELASVDDRSAPGPGGPIGLRRYVPVGARKAAPCLVYFHGGGFVIGDLASHDGLCRFLAARSGATVIAVDYRLAPEHPFPGAVIDAVAAFRWIAAHADELGVDARRLAIGGDSAGGNLAAVVSQQLVDEDGPRPCFQLLIYPATDMRGGTASRQRFAKRYFLTESMIDFFMANYLTDVSQESDVRASPLLRPSLAGLPPAHVIVAGFDPLRDEGEAYARALTEAGVPTSLRAYDGLIHGFMSMGGVIDAARSAIEDIGDELRRRLVERR